MWTNKQLQSVLIIIAAIVLSIESEQNGFSEDFLAASAVLFYLFIINIKLDKIFDILYEISLSQAYLKGLKCGNVLRTKDKNK